MIVIGLPVALCFAVPLLRVGSTVYVYDLLVLLACASMARSWSQGATNGQGSFLGALWCLWAATTISFVVGLLKVGANSHTLGHGLQFALYLTYMGLLYREILLRRIEIEQFAIIALWGAIACGFLVIMHAVLMRVAPSFALAVQMPYMAAGGWDSSFREAHTLTVMNSNGLVRVAGGWDSPTPVSGMLALGSTFLPFVPYSASFRNLAFSLMLLGNLATLSRHGAAIMLFASLFLLGGPDLPMWKRCVGAFAACGVVLIVLAGINAFTQSGSSSGSGALSLVDSMENRIVDRTYTEGLEDSSFELRYVAGTERFLRYMAREPLTILTGIGTGVYVHSLSTLGVTDPDQFGAASNAWLLMIWQFGLLGLIGYVVLHRALLFSSDMRLVGIAIVTALVTLADNYVVFMPRCFFLICSVLAMAWGELTLQRQHRR